LNTPKGENDVLEFDDANEGGTGGELVGRVASDETGDAGCDFALEDDA